MKSPNIKRALILRASIVIAGGFSFVYYFATSPFSTIIFYFTIQSNILVFVYYLVSLYHTYRTYKAGKIDLNYRPAIRGFVTLMITITGVVFAVILAPILYTSTPEQLGDFGVNQTAWRLFCSGLLHYYIPLAVILDWIFFCKKGYYRYKTTLLWFGYPLAYIVMVYVRAPFISDPTKKYIYPFFNPDIMKEWLIPGIAFLWVFFAGVAYFYVFLDNHLAKKKELNDG